MTTKIKVYSVFYPTEFGMGAQPIKASNKVLARRKFKKHFPKKKVGYIEKTESQFLIRQAL